MERISVEAVVRAVSGTLIRKCDESHITGVKHDSRECEAGDLFVAIDGENKDGHDYIPKALENGCRTVMVSHKGEWYEKIQDSELNVIMVDDTVYAMGELAKFYLDSLDVIKVAVTGSVGKTSTRDMIYYVLSEKYICGRNIKNFNNAIGLPLSIFRFDSSMEAVVLEMGMDAFGEIDRLAEIVKPNIAVITNIGVSHIENLGSREGIFRAKMEITDHITGYNGEQGVLVFKWDDEFLTRERTYGRYRQVIIGDNGKSDYIISDVDDFGVEGIKFTLEHFHKTRRISIGVPGKHNAVNGTFAVAVGELLGVLPEQAQSGLSKVQLTGRRLKYLKGSRFDIIDDTYNASPDSVKSALKVLEQSRCSGKKTAILGDMYELGDQSIRQHYGVGVFARGLDLDRIAAVGNAAKHIAEGASGGKAEVLFFENKKALEDSLDKMVQAGDIVLVKGSRGMEMEEIVESLLKI